ncbi:PREDICTED: adenylate kinase isoenzyme 1-like [Acromyrmex echinatior]|uniref:Putative adenylate kinase isoenzyme F38B2.4 n=1 Tax=Acromyrmex echinatior TaxID=103372 RepID=F4WNX9_ACREC|nr:PREDICTED: adenylate kinase isoenzyme 1-like [Acromyrmex echinatior]EGI63910.1 Putative adenylate kinase isoenzyme F38B2.4 [Acromyrmex echinatior]
MGLNCVRPVDPLCAMIPRNISLDATPIKESGLPIIFLIGGPGAGKSTQCTRIAQHYGFCAIISRQLLRTEVATGSQRGVILAYLMSEGKLIPSDVMVELIKAKMLSSLHDTRGFLLSGFPREKTQCQHFDKQIRTPDLVLYLYVRDSLLLDRILAKTITATERPQRSIEENWQRIKEQRRLMKPIFRYYKKQLVIIDGENDETEVFEDICKAIDKVMNFPNRSNKSG